MVDSGVVGPYMCDDAQGRAGLGLLVIVGGGGGVEALLDK